MAARTPPKSWLKLGAFVSVLGQSVLGHRVHKRGVGDELAKIFFFSFELYLY